MKATVYKNENDYTCVSVDNEQSIQDVLETNYTTIAQDLCELINKFNENYQNLNSMMGNLGSVYLSNLISLYFHRIIVICNALKPHQCYVHLYATFDENKTINSYDSTTPDGQEDKQYVALMSLAIQQLVRACPLEDELTEKQLQSVVEATSPLNDRFDKKYEVQSELKSKKTKRDLIN